MMRIVRYGLSILVSMLIFRVLNTVNLPSCTDCRAGLPFRYYQTSGIGGAGHWLVAGVIADLVCIIAVGIGLGWAWGQLLRRR